MKPLVLLAGFVLVISPVVGVQILASHHKLGHDAEYARQYLRSNFLIFDPVKIRDSQLPIRTNLHPRLLVATPEDFATYRDLHRIGWSLGHKSDGSPMEPADEQLRRLYDEVDQTKATLARRIPFYYAAYFALFLTDVMSIFLAFRAYRSGKEPRNSADNPQ